MKKQKASFYRVAWMETRRGGSLYHFHEDHPSRLSARVKLLSLHLTAHVIGAGITPVFARP